MISHHSAFPPGSFGYTAPALQKILLKLEPLGPHARLDLIRAQSDQLGAEWHQAELGRVTHLTLMGMTASGTSAAEAVRNWRIAARTAIGGYDRPDPSQRAAQLEWAAAVLHRPASHTARILGQSIRLVLTISANPILIARAHEVQERFRQHLSQI